MARQNRPNGNTVKPDDVHFLPIYVGAAELYKEGSITGWNSGDIPMTDGFGTGRYMMLFEGPWKVSELAGAYPDFKYATAPIPAGKGGSVSVLGGEDIGRRSQGKHGIL